MSVHFCEQHPLIASIACYPDEDENLQQFIRTNLSGHGINVSIELIDYISEKLSGDRAINRREIEKLALYAANTKTIDQQEIDSLLGDNISQLIDRLVNAVAGSSLTQSDVIIVDFGTATTFDIVTMVSGMPIYKGGIIAPGIQTSLNTLFEKASLIPKITLKKNNNVIGNDTISAVRSGFFWGYSGLIDKIVNLIKKETKRSYKLIITGGFSELFKTSIKKKVILDKNITIKGLIKISKLIN